MGHNEVGKVKTLTTITKGWLRQRLFKSGDKTARALLERPFTPLIMKITISSIVIGLKKTPFFSTNSLAKLLSDSLLLDSSKSQSHSKL